MKNAKAVRSLGIGLAMAAIGLPASAQIRTPYNSYPPTPQERAQTAELNRRAADEAANFSYVPPDADYQRHVEQYERLLQSYSGQMRAYHQAERDYWVRLNAMADWEKRAWRHPTPASLERQREQDIDRGIIGQQILILTGDYVGRVVGVDRNAGRDIDGIYVSLEGGKVVWIDVGDVRYDSPYGVIYTDLTPGALRHMPDERG